MPVSKRTGKKYAAGSTTTLGGWEPRVCCICQGRVVVSREGLRFYMDDTTHEAFSWHLTCERLHGHPRLPGGVRRDETTSEGVS